MFIRSISCSELPDSLYVLCFVFSSVSNSSSALLHAPIKLMKMAIIHKIFGFWILDFGFWILDFGFFHKMELINCKHKYKFL